VKPARVVLKKQEKVTSPPQGYLSVVQAAKAGPWSERQLRRFIWLGRLSVVIIDPAPGSKRGRGRKTVQWIHPDALAAIGTRVWRPGGIAGAPKCGGVWVTAPSEKKATSIAVPASEPDDATPSR